MPGNTLLSRSAASTLSLLIGAAVTSIALGLTGCDDGNKLVDDARQPVVADANSPAFYATRFGRTPSVTELTDLGREMFFDPRLSASGKLSCSSCHDPQYAYGPSGPESTPSGGLTGGVRGFRAAPSLRYLQSVPAFTEHMHDTDGDDSADQGPAGGHTWDGRVQSLHDQARLPLFSAHEMANSTARLVAEKILAAPYAGRMVATFGSEVLNSPTTTVNAALLALEVFQQSPQEFYPYSSKYDAYLRGRAALTAQERRGLALFNDPEKGNCASCHPSAMKEGASPAFSDFGFVALGVPRNREIPANRDPAFFDLGLCGPERVDMAAHHEYCGMFRTPSLRNVALRRSYFHNGVFHSLRRVIDFYVERDIAPDKWYPRTSKGDSLKFDDLPARYAQNVNVDPPFDRRPGDRPALTTRERDDVVAFLKTLSDGYRGPLTISGDASPETAKAP
jgi:cytochrome c peroxidase